MLRMAASSPILALHHLILPGIPYAPTPGQAHPPFVVYRERMSPRVGRRPTRLCLINAPTARGAKPKAADTPVNSAVCQGAATQTTSVHAIYQTQSRRVRRAIDVKRGPEADSPGPGKASLLRSWASVPGG